MQWHTPMGYKVINGKIEIYEEHGKIVEKIFKDYDSGVSAAQLAKSLKENGIKNTHNRTGWTHVSVGVILENHNYLGTEDYPQLIDKELFERVQKRREQVRIDKGRGRYRPNRRERFIFSGTIICATCGGTYSHIRPRSKRESEVAKWKCKNYIYQNRLSCKGGDISDKQVEEVCVRAMNELLRNPRLTEKWSEKKERINSEFRRLERVVENVETLEIEETKVLLFQKATERYKTLEVRDESIRSVEMREILTGMEEIKNFDEELYRKLIKQIIVYKDDSVRVVFRNNNSVKISYQNE